MRRELPGVRHSPTVGVLRVGISKRFLAANKGAAYKKWVQNSWHELYNAHYTIAITQLIYTEFDLLFSQRRFNEYVLYTARNVLPTFYKQE